MSRLGLHPQSHTPGHYAARLALTLGLALGLAACGGGNPGGAAGASAATAQTAGTELAASTDTTTPRATAQAVTARSWRPPVDTGSGLEFGTDQDRGFVVRTHTVAVDAAGNAITAWYIDNGFGAAGYKLLHRAAGSDNWVEAEFPMGAPDPDGFESNSNLQLATLPNGDAVALWAWRNGFRGEVRSAHYSAATKTWTGPTVVPGDRFDGVELEQPPRLIADGRGGVLLVGIGSPTSDDTGWQRLGLWLASYDIAGQRWKEPVNLRTLSLISFWDGPLDVQLTGDGKVFISYAVRCLTDNTSYAFVQLYDPATGKWRWPNPLSTGQKHAHAPRVMPLDYGRAVITWSGSGSESGSWWRLVGPDSWPLTAPAQVPGAPADTLAAATGRNDAFLLFSDGVTPIAQWRAQRYDGRNKRWDAAQPVFAQTVADASEPQFAHDGAGNLTAAWDAGDATGATREIRTRRWSASGARWETPTLPGVHALATNSPGYASTWPRIAAHADGRVTTVWTTATGFLGSTRPVVDNYAVHVWSAEYR